MSIDGAFWTQSKRRSDFWRDPGDEKRFVVRAEEKLTAFVELERGEARIGGGFDLVNHFGIAVGRAKSKVSFLREIVLTAFRQVSQYRAALSPLGVSTKRGPPHPLSAGLTVSERLVHTNEVKNTRKLPTSRLRKGTALLRLSLPPAIDATPHKWRSKK